MVHVIYIQQYCHYHHCCRKVRGKGANDRNAGIEYAYLKICGVPMNDMSVRVCQLHKKLHAF